MGRGLKSCPKRSWLSLYRSMACVRPVTPSRSSPIGSASDSTGMVKMA